MGGRGASSGVSDKGKKYGTEYETLLTVGNIKFVRYADSNSAKIPLETRTKGRVYAVVNAKGDINSIDYYDNSGKHRKSINILHSHNQFPGMHTHEGYYHAENGTHNLTANEKKLVDFLLRTWHNRRNK